MILSVCLIVFSLLSFAFSVLVYRTYISPEGKHPGGSLPSSLSTPVCVTWMTCVLVTLVLSFICAAH